MEDIRVEDRKAEAIKAEKEKWTIAGSMFAKIVAFFLLAISTFAGALGLIVSVVFWNEGVYQKGIEEMIHDRMVNSVWNEVAYLKAMYKTGNTEAIDDHLKASNLFVDIYEDETLLWGNYDGREIPEAYSFVCYTDCFIPMTEEELKEYNNAITEDVLEKYGLEPLSEDERGILEEYYPEVTDTEEIVRIIKELRSKGHLQVENGFRKEYTEDSYDGYQADFPEGFGEFDESYVGSDGYESFGEEDVEEYIETTALRPAKLTFRVYVNTEFPVEDEFKSIYDEWDWSGSYSDMFPVMAIGGLFFALCCFIFLMCSAGHHNGQEGIQGGVLSYIHFDILTIIFGFVACVGILMSDFIYYANFRWVDLVALCILAMAEVIWITIYSMEFAVQMKKGTLFKHTLCWTILVGIGKVFKKMGKGILGLFRGLPMVWNAMLWFGALCIVDFVVMFICFGIINGGSFIIGVFLWLLEKGLLLAVVLYVALMCKKLQQGSEALAEGDLNYQLDDSNLIGDFKKHGENLNSIKEGISRAVDERMKSEHLKTELITNVSHDLKTPLTSIINYADLLGAAVSEAKENASEENTEKNEAVAIDQEQIAEYADVLLRQSKRLKKLLDDLMEASKATTGNLEVNLMPCEVGVILSQAVGEYEQRFAGKDLELIVRQPEETVKILADGRHLWRVFDNLMNNICKYAQENTRVYLSVEKSDKQVQIVFRNMSKYPLELSAEELKERFTRGDKSRHMEGNGLGLSIAGSLVELQNGTMEVVTDGDLFKVVLSFPILA